MDGKNISFFYRSEKEPKIRASKPEYPLKLQYFLSLFATYRIEFLGPLPFKPHYIL